MRNCRRSRKGAWIEIAFGGNSAKKQAGRSRKGAWIEIEYAQIQLESA